MGKKQITVFQYPRCETCKKALRWLDQHSIDYEAVDIVHSPPPLDELQTIHSRSGLPVSKLFNTSGQSYRQGNVKEKLKSWSDVQALEALSRDGKLIKRPVILGEDFVLVGFKEAEYEEVLNKSENV